MSEHDDARLTDDVPVEGLAEVLARRFLTTDDARPDKVARWHAKGRRTARENIADLIDPGSLVEYGRFVTAAQESRRDLADLVVDTPADGIIGGTATVDGGSYGGSRPPTRWAPCCSSRMSRSSKPRSVDGHSGSDLLNWGR